MKPGVAKVTDHQSQMQAHLHPRDAGSVTAVDDAGTDNLVNDSGMIALFMMQALRPLFRDMENMRFVLMLFAGDTVPSMEAPMSGLCDDSGCSDNNLCTVNDTCDTQGNCAALPVICNTPPNTQCTCPMVVRPPATATRQ